MTFIVRVRMIVKVRVTFMIEVRITFVVAGIIEPLAQPTKKAG